MEVERKPLPYKVVDAINIAVLKKYREYADGALQGITTVVLNSQELTNQELTLRRLTKTVGEPMILDTAEEQSTPTEGMKLSKFDVTLPTGSLSSRIHHALAGVTEQMNRTPLRIDNAIWRANLVKASEHLSQTRERSRELADNPEFNPNSTKECIFELRDKRGLSLPRKGTSGAASVDKDALQFLVEQGSELALSIIEAREAQARFSQLEKWGEYARVGSVQPVWDQEGTPHGRYTAEHPNIQNRITEIRETVIPAEGFSFISADWGMAEYVTWASLSGDEFLTQIFSTGRDLHQEMGSLVKSVAPNTEEPRKAGKVVNLALLYRMQPWTLAASLGIGVEVAESIVETFQKRAPQAVRYIESVLKDAARNGYVETKYGRRLNCSGLSSLKGFHLKNLQKTVWHHHNAGTAAEMLKAKMIDLNDQLSALGVSQDLAKIVLNMHDEIILEVADGMVGVVSDVLLKVMSTPAPGTLPFKVDLRVGKSWLAISK